VREQNAGKQKTETEFEKKEAAKNWHMQRE